jgi:MscS family membrane protein
MEKLSTIFYSISDSLTLTHYVAAAGCLVGGWVLRQILMAVLKRIVHLSAKTETAVDDILIDAAAKPLSWMCFLLGVWAAFEVLPLPSEAIAIESTIRIFIKAVTVWLVIWFAIRLVDRTARHMESRAVEAKSAALDFVPLFRKTAKIVLVVLGILIIIQNLGFSVASLLAGLGLGGLAIGLAAKDTIANFFGSVVIFVDRPFTRGDWIKIGEHEGIVEEIGVRVTRIRTFADHLITIPNAQLTITAITNFTAMRKRRVKFDLAIPYRTEPEKLELAIARVKALISTDTRFVPDDFAVYVSEFGTYSVTMQVTCFTTSTAFAEWAQSRHDLLLNIDRLFAELGIEFALPTQMVVGQTGGTIPVSRTVNSA